ncbi:hypothetical protein [Myroides odoratimimus]|nr:hypothetical protein [Myroides odoratimimus]
MTYIKGDSFGSQFNADWASMLLVAIDEVFFDKRDYRAFKVPFYY